MANIHTRGTAWRPLAPCLIWVLLLGLTQTSTTGALADASTAASSVEGFADGVQRRHALADQRGFSGGSSGQPGHGAAQQSGGSGWSSVEEDLWAGGDGQTSRRSGARQITASSKAQKNKRRPAKGGAYVSLGKVRAFVGDLYPSPSLALALENRSFKRELILITDTRPRAALQLFYNLAQLGLVHTLWLTSGHSSCASMDKLAAARDKLIGQRTAAQQAVAAASVGDDVGVGVDAAGRLLAADGSAAAGISGAAAASLAAAYLHGGDGSAAEVLHDDDLMGCAWYSQPFPSGFTGHRRLMMKRIMLLARAVRLGYNVLSLDTDVIVYRDPYPLLKAPPHSAMHMVVGKSVRSGGVANTGVMYVQNAARGGPVAWLLAEVVGRNLRWVEHNVSMPHMEAAAEAAATGAPATGVARLMPAQADSRGCWDQFLFGDVVLTAATGKLVLLYCARPVSRRSGPGVGPGAVGSRRKAASEEKPGRKGEEDGGWTARHFQAMKAINQQSPNGLMKRESISVEGNAALVSLVGAKSYVTTTVSLAIPRDPGPLLADEPGYSLPALQPGGAAEAFLKVLQADANLAASRSGAVGSAGLSRHAARSLRQGAAAAGEAAGDESGGGNGGGSGDAAGSQDSSGSPPGTERLTYAADWLIGGWPQRGVLGYWDPNLTNGKPKQVFGHLVRAPGPTGLGKEAVRMQYGEYDWELAALAAGGPYPFLGSPNAAEAPRLVALLPDVDTATESQVQWASTARGLAQIALLTGRRVVWPSVPCNSDWVQPNPGSRRALPLNMNLRFLAHGTFADGLMCTPVAVLHQKCLYTRHVVQRNDSAVAMTTEGGAAEGEDGGGGPEYVTRVEGPRGLLPQEFELLRRLLPSETEPGPHNTVHLQTNDDYEDGGERPIMFDEPPRTEGIAYVKASAIAKPLREGPLAAQRVLYLAQRTFLTQLEKLGEAELTARYRAFRNECPALK